MTSTKHTTPPTRSRRPTQLEMDAIWDRDLIEERARDLRRCRAIRRGLRLVVNNDRKCVAAPAGARLNSEMRKSENFLVLDTGHIDGGAYRIVKFADGSARVEEWTAKGWVPGGATFGEFMFSPPVGPAFAARLGIPPDDLKRG